MCAWLRLPSWRWIYVYIKTWGMTAISSCLPYFPPWPRGMWNLLSSDTITDTMPEGPWLPLSLSVTFFSVVGKVATRLRVSTKLSLSLQVRPSLFFPLGERSIGNVLGEDVKCGNSAKVGEVLTELQQENSLLNTSRAEVFVSLERYLLNAWTALATAGSWECLWIQKASMVDVKLAFIYWNPCWVLFSFLSREDLAGGSFELDTLIFQTLRPLAQRKDRPDLKMKMIFLS